MKEMNYAESGKWLSSLKVQMQKFGLESIKKMVKYAAINTNSRVVHIAGSSGKGSTSAFAAAILTEAGYKTGLYTSPHILEQKERIRINNKEISEKEFAELASFARKIIEENKINASYFEAITLMALKKFSDEKAEFIVAETGMGGRLDATNILKGEVCVITPISMEHSQYLGNTIEKIAGEKAGIIKKGSKVVARKENAGIKVIEQKAKENGAELYSPEFKIEKDWEHGASFSVLKPFQMQNIKLGMKNHYQCENAAAAVTAVHLLGEPKITEEAIRRGIEKTKIMGRTEEVQQEPKIILDVGHNPYEWKTMFTEVKAKKHKKLIIIFGSMKDKKFEEIKKIIEGNCDKLILTKADAERAAEPEELKKAIGFGEIAGSVKKAVNSAVKEAGSEDLILITGSFYIVGEAVKALKNKNAQKSKQ